MSGPSTPSAAEAAPSPPSAAEAAPSPPPEEGAAAPAPPPEADIPTISPVTVMAMEEMYTPRRSLPFTSAGRSGKPPSSRGAEVFRVLPVLFVSLLIIFCYTVYIGFHCVPLLQLGIPSLARHPGMVIRGKVELVLFNVFFVLFAISYILSIITAPGTIPDRPEWTSAYGEDGSSNFERKKEGSRRYCKWCCKYKPDRAHHCRQCGRCVLKMDHHCPWIYNCVGWGNHKYFILTLIYATICSVLVAGTMSESVRIAINEQQVRFGVLILLLVVQVLSSLLALISVAFLSFHIYLISHNLSTIEFCEKQFRRNRGRNVYHKGVLKNAYEIFGDHWILWLIPIDNRSGDGLHFTVNPEQVKLADALETEKSYLRNPSSLSASLVDIPPPPSPQNDPSRHPLI